MVDIEIQHITYREVHKLAQGGEHVRDTPHLGARHAGNTALTFGGIATDITLVDTGAFLDEKDEGAGHFDGGQFVNKSWKRAPSASLVGVELNGKKNRGIATKGYWLRVRRV